MTSGDVSDIFSRVFRGWITKSLSNGKEAVNVNDAEAIALLTTIAAGGGGITFSGENSIATAATGTSFKPLTATDCKSLIIVNYQSSGTTIEYRHVILGGAAIPVPNGSSSVEIRGITNAEEIEIRRVDQSNTPYTVYFAYEG